MHRSQAGEGIRLVFADDLTVATFKRMRDQLAEALSGSDRVELELGTIKAVDRSLIELVCGVHRVADSLGKSFRLASAETVRTIQKLAVDSGYAHLPCAHRSSQCLYGHACKKERTEGGE